MTEVGADRVAVAVARSIGLRRRLATLALTVASIEDELASTFDHLAQRNVVRADELHALAAAARAHAGSERELSRRINEQLDSAVSR